MWENIYCLYDNNAGIALKPIIVERNDVVPVRQFTQLVNDEKSILHTHSGEFDLVQFGRINLETLEIEPGEQRIVANGADLKAKPQE